MYMYVCLHARVLWCAPFTAAPGKSRPAAAVSVSLFRGTVTVARLACGLRHALRALCTVRTLLANQMSADSLGQSGHGTLVNCGDGSAQRCRPVRVS